MRRLLLLLALVLGCGAPWGKERLSDQNIEAWVTSYYLAPTPGEVADALAVLAAKGLLGNGQAESPLSGFFAEVFRANPGRIDQWVQPYVGVPNRSVIYTALWVAYSNESMFALRRMADMAPMEEGTTLRVLRSSPPPTIETIPIDRPSALDFLWGSFWATGSDVPVLRIIDQMKLANRRGDANAVLIGTTAQSSVSAAARQHAKVLAIVKERARTADPETRVKLDEIISSIETERAKK
jgi:hypothetical protein